VTRTASGASSWPKSSASGPPAQVPRRCTTSGRRRTSSTVDDPHAVEATSLRTDGTYAASKATTQTRRLEVVALRVLRGQVELDQGHPQMILELLEIFDGTVLLPPALRVEGLEELRVDPI
jgi:hypothetical protein